MADTPRLVVPYIAENQASKYITHNEALDAYDVLVQSNVLDRDLSTPPGSPASGDAYLVKATGTGAWAGHDNAVAVYISAQWKFHTPDEGWKVYVQDENLGVYWDGSAWQVDPTSGTFLGLSDVTEATYTGHAGESVVVNGTEDGLEFGPSSGGATDFIDLGDVPASYAGDALKYVRVNAGETGLEFTAGTSGAFTDLTDTFASYAGNAQKFIAVKATEDGVEAVDAPGGALGLARGALLRRTADQTIATATATKITWQAEIYDTDAMWSSGTAITVPSGITKAMVFGQIRIATAVIPNLRIRVLKNNAIAYGLTYLNIPMNNPAFGGQELGVVISSPPIAVSAGDTFELEIYQDSGASLNVKSGEHTSFGVILVTDSASTTAQYVTMATDATLSNERVLTAGVNMKRTDGGAGAAVTLDALTENISIPGDISPTQITADADNYAPTGLATASTLRLSTDASRNLTGLTGGADGRLILVHNIGSFSLVLLNESTASTAANRFAFSADLTLASKDSCLLRYDATTSRWRIVAASVLPGGTTGVPDAKADGSTKGIATFAAADFNDNGSGLISLDYTNGPVGQTRALNTTSPLSGGGNLTTDRTISIADAVADGATKGAATFASADFNSAAGVISLDYTNGQAASGSTKGYLTSADWTTFNNKGSGNGDASTNTSTSVDSEVVLFSGTAGKTLKRATQTGIAKVTSGVLSAVTAPTGTIVGTSDTQTLTNKTVQPRVVTVSDATSITPNADTTDICKQVNTQSAGTLTLNNPTGTPYDGQRLQVIIDSTNSHTVSFGTSYRGSTDLTITGISTSGSGKTDYLLFQYHGTDSKWDYLAKNFGF